ncbi:MAG: hypothetical protein ABR977_04735 [Candidatus Dormibacteria bacterium]
MRRPAVAVAGWVALGLLLALAIGRLSQRVPLSSDQASSVLEGWAMGHGNLLLRGWTLPADGFVTTKLPLLALLERFQGLTPEVVYEVAGLLGAGVVVAGAWLAGGRLRGATRAVAMLVTGALLASQTLLLPGTGGGSFPAGVMLPAGTDHAATLLLLLTACLALQGSGRSWVWPAVAWVALAAASIGDPLAAVVGGGGLAVVGAVGLATRRRGAARLEDRATEGAAPAASPTTSLLVIGVTSAVAVPIAWWSIRGLGGFTAAPLLGGGYGLPVPVASLGHNLSVGGRALLTVFGADVIDRPAGLGWAAALLHLCGLGLVLAVLGWLLRPRRWLGLDPVSRVLSVGMLLDAGAYLAGQQATDLTSARYLVPLLGFGAVLAGREGVPRLLARRPRLGFGLLALVAAYAGVFAAGVATVQPAPAAFAGVDAWLAGHGATYGLGTYWDANVVTVATRGAIAVRSIETSTDGVTPFLWHSTTSWYDPSTQRATFVLLAGGDAVDRAAIAAALGSPSETATVDGTTIMVWPGNLLDRLSAP